VVSFVTFEKEPPSAPPLVHYGTGKELTRAVTGVSHIHVTSAGDRRYFMHFVHLQGLLERTRYQYSVQSGTVGAQASSTFSFRSGYSSGVTKVITPHPSFYDLCYVISLHSFVQKWEKF